MIDEETYELLKTEGFTIYGYTGSEAEAYANRNGFSFVPCDGTFTSFAELSSSEITLGKTVDITCDAIGGTAPYEFAFYYKYSTDSNYKTLQGYSSSSKANFKPHEEGTYSIVVKVKDGEGNVLRKEMPLTVKAVLKNNTGISATSIILGESVTITGGATGGAAPYQYSYFYKKSTDSKYTTLKNYSSKKVFEFTPEEAGTYTVVSKVKDSEGTVSRKEFTVYVSDLENNSSISSDSIVLGNSITVKGEGAGGETPYKFSYYYKKTTDKSYKTLKYNTTVSEVSFKPESAGSYYIVVKVIDSKGTVVRKQFTLTVRETLKNNSYISEEEIVLGKTVTITGEATGGTEPYQYAFYYKNTMESSYKTLQAYSSESTATFKPKADGTYSIVVKVKDSDGTVSRKEMTLTVKRALKNDTGISSSSIKLGESVKVTGGAIGGTEPYQYSYFYKKSTDSTYTTLKGYSSKNVVYFKPEEAGTYTFVSKVKDSDGTVSRKEFTIYVSDLTNNSMLSSTSIALGETVTITGEASGGETPYKFAFYYKNSTSSSYKTLKDYSSQSVVSFKPDSTGSYSIVVKVKDNAGTVQRMEFTLVVS